MSSSAPLAPPDRNGAATPLPSLVLPTTRQPRAEDWRVLAVLGPYRLLLVAVLLGMYHSGFAPEFFGLLKPHAFYVGCISYAGAALILLVLGIYQRPSLVAQAHLHVLADALTIGTLVYGTGGIGGGLGILLIPPVIGCSLILTPRLASVQAAVGTFAIFGAEAAHQLTTQTWDSSTYSQAGLLGLMLFASSLVANTVAQRARRSEAVAERVGSEFVSLSRLSENIIESMHTGVLVIDPNDEVRVANAAARRLAGEALVPGLSLQTVLPQLALALRDWRSGRAPPLQTFVAASTGRELTPSVTRLGWGVQAQLLVLLDDAAQLRQQAQQIKLASLGRLSAGIAHEIRNPLSAITQASQLLSESHEIADENQRLLEMIQRHAARIEHIVRDVLELSRRDQSRQIELPLRDWLTKTVALYHESHPRGLRPIELSDIPADTVVRFDADHLQQILFNLWDNSFEHGARNHRSVAVVIQGVPSADGDAINIDISDDGPGIPQELQERVFEPFFTTHNTGTGLGLFLCRELCEYNHALLTYLPSRHGATFRIRFSAVRADAGPATTETQT